jgi:hypothetical protein
MENKKEYIVHNLKSQFEIYLTEDLFRISPTVALI